MVGIIIAVIIIVLIITNIRVVQQARAYVVERLGAYKETWNVGMHVKLPFIDRVAKRRLPQGAGCGLPAPASYHQG